MKKKYSDTRICQFSGLCNGLYIGTLRVRKWFGSGVQQRDRRKYIRSEKNFKVHRQMNLEQIRDRMQNCSEAMMQKQEFQDGENSEEGTDGIRYIKGRPLTEEERKEELELKI